LTQIRVDRTGGDTHEPDTTEHAYLGGDGGDVRGIEPSTPVGEDGDNEAGEVHDVVQLGDYRPTDSAEAVFDALKGRIEAVIEEFDALVSQELDAFNREAAKARVGAAVA